MVNDWIFVGRTHHNFLKYDCRGSRWNQHISTSPDIHNHEGLWKRICDIIFKIYILNDERRDWFSQSSFVNRLASLDFCLLYSTRFSPFIKILWILNLNYSSKIPLKMKQIFFFFFNEMLLMLQTQHPLPPLKKYFLCAFRHLSNSQLKMLPKSSPSYPIEVENKQN